MVEDLIKRMWRIDGEAQVGNEISEGDTLFFNKNLSYMRQEIEDDCNHWRYSTGEI